MNTIVLDWSAYKGKVPGYGAIRAKVGEYAGLFPSKHVVSAFSGFTFTAPLPTNGEDVIYLQIPRAPGDGRMAGLAGLSNVNLEWDVNVWRPKGPTYGPNAVIYDAAGRYVEVASRAEYNATMGWRYVDAAGSLVNCKSTYTDDARGLYEFAEWDDVAIGQGADGIGNGAVILFPGEKLRRFDPRPEGQRTYPFNARFMRYDRAGNDFGWCVVDADARKTYFCWPTLADLRAQPFVEDTPIPPVEPPVSTLPDPAAVKAALQHERDKYPATVTETQMGAILNDAAFKFADCGMHRKAGQATQPVTGIGISHDVMRYMPANDPLGWWADVLGATGAGLASPQAPDWQRSSDGRESFVPAVDSGGQPPVEPPSGDHEARIAAIERKLALVEAAWAR